MNFMIYASYHSRLEMAFCMDEFLKPPVKEEINFDLEESVVSITSKESKEAKENDVVEKNKKNLSSAKNNSKESLVVNKNDMKIVKLDSDKLEEIGGMTEGSDVTLSDNKSSGLYQKHSDTSACDNSEKSIQSDQYDVGENTIRTVTNKVQSGSQVAERKKSDIVKESERTCSFINFESDHKNLIKAADSEAAVVREENVRNKENDDVKVVFELGNELEENIENQSRNVNLSDIVSLSNHNTENGECTTTLAPSQGQAGNQSLTPELRRKNPSGSKKDRSPTSHRKSQTTQLTDKSDPLYSYQINHDESIFQSSITLQEQLVTHR